MPFGDAQLANRIRNADTIDENKPSITSDLSSFVGCFFSWLDPKGLRAKQNRTASNVGLLLRWSVCVDDVDPVRQSIYRISDEISTVGEL